MRDARAPAEVQQPDGAIHVGAAVAAGIMERLAHSSQRGEVDDGIEDPVGEMVLADVALVEQHPIRQRRFRRQVVQGGDPVACGVELADDVAADKAGGTGDEDGHGLGIHARGWASTGSLNSSSPSANFACVPCPVLSGCAHETATLPRLARRRNTCACGRACIVRAGIARGVR